MKASRNGKSRKHNHKKGGKSRKNKTFRKSRIGGRNWVHPNDPAMRGY